MRVAFKAFDKMAKLSSLKKSRFQRNKHPKEQIESLAKIMREHGVRQPIHLAVLNGEKTDEIAFGHGRKEAAKLNKWEDYPIIYQEFESEEEYYSTVQSDNAIAMWAELDLSAINTDILDMGPDFDIELLGIEDFVIEPAEKFEAKCDEDEVPQYVDTMCKEGDLWILGEHRLLCGDATNVQHVEKLMDGAKADMVFTDPPYGMGLDTDYSQLPKAPNGATPLKHDRGLVDDFNPEMINSIMALDCKETFIFGADYFAEHLPEKNKGSWVVWDKRVTEKFDKMIGSAFELCWSRSKHKREIARFNNTLFSGESDARNKVHPTQKPIKLVDWFLDKYSEQNNNVLDLFGGSGSTLIACEKTNRKCFMMEIDPKYCDVIKSRWEKYTGKEAKLDG